MKEAKTFGLHFGALCESIEYQLKEQKLKFDIEQVKRFDEQADDILKLHFANILTDSMAESCRKRLFKHITKHINHNNP